MIVNRKRRLSVHQGGGLISSLTSLPGKILNRTIDILPVELHIPGYQYCGPGTKLQKRLNRGDPGINKLDQACKEHDIAYSKNSDSHQRSLADQQLANKAWERVISSDANIGERAAAYAVTNMMKLKNKFGGGNVKKTKNKIKKRKECLAKKRITITKKCLNEVRKLLCKKDGKKKGKGYFLKPYKGRGCNKKKSS